MGDRILEALNVLAPFKKLSVPDSQEVIHEALYWIKRRWIPSLLATDTSLLRSLVANSYFHENGFYKLTIMDFPLARFRLRFHFWPKSERFRTGVENVHNHRFNYYSCVLKGALTNRVWLQASAGYQFRRYEYAPRSLTEFYELKYVGENHLKVEDEQLYTAGDLYSMKADELHTSTPCHEGEVITLFLEELPVRRQTTDVFSTRYPSCSLPIQSPSLTSNQYLDTLTAATSLLD